MPKLKVSCSPHVDRSSRDERRSPSMAPTSSKTITGSARKETTLNAVPAIHETIRPAAPRRSSSWSSTIDTTVASTAHPSRRTARARAAAKAEPRGGSPPAMRSAAPAGRGGGGGGGGEGGPGGGPPPRLARGGPGHAGGGAGGAPPGAPPVGGDEDDPERDVPRLRGVGPAEQEDTRPRHRREGER